MAGFLSRRGFGLVLLVLLTLAAVTAWAEMVVETTDGRTYTVPISAGDLATIRFTDTAGSGKGQSTSSTSSTKETKIYLEDQFNDLANWGGTATQRKVTNGVAEFYSGNHTTFELNPPIPVENVIVEWRGAAFDNGFHGSVGNYIFNIGGWNNSASGGSGPNTPFQKLHQGKVYQSGKFHIWKVQRIGDEWSAYVDNRKIWSLNITERASQPWGPLRFTTHNGKLQMDWIKIRSISE